MKWSELRFPCGSAGKKPACNSGDLDSIPGLGRSAGEERGYPLQYSGLENSMDCIVYGAPKSRTDMTEWLLLHVTSYILLILLKNNPIKKQRSWLDFSFQRRYEDGQQTHEKILSITNHHGNANQNHNEKSPHTHQKVDHQKDKK